MSGISPEAWRSVQDAERQVANAEFEHAQQLPKWVFAGGLALTLYGPEVPLPTVDVQSAAYPAQGAPTFAVREAATDIPTSTILGLSLIVASVGRMAQSHYYRRREAFRILRSTPNDFTE